MLFRSITITENLRFYSGVGTKVNGLPTIPSTNQDLMYYPRSMFPYEIIQMISHQGVVGAVENLVALIVSPMQNSEFGFYFYLVLPIMLTLLLLREKRAYFAIFWFTMLFLALEFGPMHLGISTNPLRIDYLPAYRLNRFLLVLTVPLAGIIGIGLAKLLESKDKYVLLLGALAVCMVLTVLYLANYNTSNFYYYWQHYPQELVMQAVNFIKTLPATTTVYLEGTYNNANVGYSSSEINTYLGNPQGNRVNFSITASTGCSAFAANSYVIWSGSPHCASWRNVLDIKTPDDIPAFIVQDENPLLNYRPTNIYYVEPQNS